MRCAAHRQPLWLPSGWHFDTRREDEGTLPQRFCGAHVQALPSRLRHRMMCVYTRGARYVRAVSGWSYLAIYTTCLLEVAALAFPVRRITHAAMPDICAIGDADGQLSDECLTASEFCA